MIASRARPQPREILVGTVAAMTLRMRLVIALALLAACGSNSGDVYESSPDLSSPTGADLSLPADCPTGFQSPAYCFSGPQGTGSSCGACANVGELCDYFEATLICAGDHSWRCYWAGGISRGCPHPDGGT
ncbi:MAG TPA: hypothetical protein VHB97_26955 [Polyangia bacterium]|nr:hypothetical protein [Polyangia bacterium]